MKAFQLKYKEAVKASAFTLLTFVLLLFTALITAAFGHGEGNSPYQAFDEDLMPHGMPFQSWETPMACRRTFYVDQAHPEASDLNPGSERRPWQTINHAAQHLQPGDRVLIKGGVYRESVHPARGGSGPGEMITYQAAEGAKVVIKGSVILKEENWQPGKGWRYNGPRHTYEDGEEPGVKTWQYGLESSWFGGYNPFGMMNISHDREWVDYRKIKMDAHFRRRGMIFLNGEPLEQVEHSVDLAEKTNGAFWVEHNGLRIHVRFPGDKGPGDFLAEATVKEQVFAPKEYGLGYIKLKGITFQHAGNGFPVPQRGLVSAARGHHWIIEDCTIEWANSLGIDLGNEMWHTITEPTVGHHIIRRNTIRNCGIAGLEGMKAEAYLVEDNLFENIGWQDAEHGWESGAIKFHRARNTLIRRNIFRNITFAPGIWMDYLSSQNCRITKNVFTGITTARGAVYVEVSRGLILIDHNVFHQLRSQYWISGEYGAGGNALYTDGSDSIVFRNNLAFDIENTGYGSYINNTRIVAGRGGAARSQKVLDNIFADCRKYAIEFPNEYNHSDGNLFSGMPAGFLKLKNPPPELFLDLKAWQEFYGWEKRGEYTTVITGFDPATLQLTLEVLSAFNERAAGPFVKGKNLKDQSIDPRK